MGRQPFNGHCNRLVDEVLCGSLHALRLNSLNRLKGHFTLHVRVTAKAMTCRRSMTPMQPVTRSLPFPISTSSRSSHDVSENRRPREELFFQQGSPRFAHHGAKLDMDAFATELCAHRLSAGIRQALVEGGGNVDTAISMISVPLCLSHRETLTLERRS